MLAFAPTQNIATGGGDAVCSVTGLALGRTFYEDTVANLGKWMSQAITATDYNTKTKLTATNLQNLYIGDQHASCFLAKLDLANSGTVCQGFVQFVNAGDTTGDIKTGSITGRIISTGLKIKAAVDPTNSTVGNQTSATTLEYWNFDADLIMGAIFQSFGTAADGTTWCHGSWHNEVAVDAAQADLKAAKGIGAKGKCSW